MTKILIAYESRKGETTAIATYLAEGARMAGAQVDLKNIKEIKNESELSRYDALVLGSPTYHADMMNGMKTFLFLAEKADLDGKTGGAFGAYGWSGESIDRIYDTMKNILQMTMVTEPLRLKSSKAGGGISMAQDYGKLIVEKANS